MAVRDFSSQRLFLEADLAKGVTIAASAEQSNYLRNVLRLASGARLLVFNGRDGEWEATLGHDGRKGASLAIGAQIRVQSDAQDVWYLFAPLKRARLDYMVQKAVEMGAGRLVPVLTQHTVAERVSLERMRANVIEAAEQCGVLAVPEVAEPQRLSPVLECWDGRRRLIFCDESAAVADPIAALRALTAGPVAVLVGPEGGFSEAERVAILALSVAVPISLGPRIMRADTAAVAVLTLVNACLGDWR